MATRTWGGNDPGNEGDLGTAANWSGATLPVGGDTILFNGSSNQSVTAGLADLSFANLTNDNLANVIVAPSYTGNIGSSGAYLDCGIDTILDYSGTGVLYQQNTGAAATPTITCGADDQSATGGLILGGACTLLVVNKGRCEVDAGGTATTCTVSMLHSNHDAVLVLTAGGTVTTLNCVAGRVTSDVALTTVNLGHMGFIQHGQNADVDITEVNQLGGHFNYRNGDITTYNGFWGRLIGDESGRERTITTLNSYTGFTADLAAGSGVITITNDNRYGTGKPTVST